MKFNLVFAFAVSFMLLISTLTLVSDDNALPARYDLSGLGICTNRTIYVTKASYWVQYPDSNKPPENLIDIGIGISIDYIGKNAIVWSNTTFMTFKVENVSNTMASITATEDLGISGHCHFTLDSSIILTGAAKNTSAAFYNSNNEACTNYGSGVLMSRGNSCHCPAGQSSTQQNSWDNTDSVINGVSFQCVAEDSNQASTPAPVCPQNFLGSTNPCPWNHGSFGGGTGYTCCPVDKMCTSQTQQMLQKFNAPGEDGSFSGNTMLGLEACTVINQDTTSMDSCQTNMALQPGQSCECGGADSPYICDKVGPDCSQINPNMGLCNTENYITCPDGFVLSTWSANMGSRGLNCLASPTNNNISISNCKTVPPIFAYGVKLNAQQGNPNTGYATLSEAQGACETMESCTYIMRWSDDLFYLREWGGPWLTADAKVAVCRYRGTNGDHSPILTYSNGVWS